MELLFTNGGDTRFIALCHLLDRHLNEAVGGETQRQYYNQYNALDDIHDVALVLEDSEAVACGGFKACAPGTAEIKRVFTQPTHRGHGYGRAVMAALETRASEQGYTRLVLETGAVLAPAMRLYTALGYRVIPNYGPYACMPQSICMEKRLTKQPSDR